MHPPPSLSIYHNQLSTMVYVYKWFFCYIYLTLCKYRLVFANELQKVMNFLPPSAEREFWKKDGCIYSVQFSGDWLFATPWTTAHQASLSITNSWSLLKLMSINHSTISPSVSPSPPALCLSQHLVVFHWVSSSHQVAKVLEFQHQYFQWTFRTDLL